MMVRLGEIPEMYNTRHTTMYIAVRAVEIPVPYNNNSPTQ
jgi:hypothetical protein